jgi:putative endopeptidase
MKITPALFVSFLSLVLAAAATAQTPQEPALPYSPSLNVGSMDKSVDPCQNFYKYSCGRWQQNNPIPPDQTSWSVYAKLYQDNLNFLRGILEQAAASKNQTDAVAKKIGDFYAACIDEPAVEARV